MYLNPSSNNLYGGFRQYQPYGTQQPLYGTQPMQGQPYFPSQQQPAYPQQQQTAGAGMPQQQQIYTPGTPAPPAPAPEVPGMLPLEQSFIENILRLNKGKLITVYATFENNREWNAKIFKGIIEAAGRDHLILSDPQTGLRYLIPMIYLDYITFEEEIEYF
ncbi:spore coat protein GerQ [Bacillaceae bacterium Marseille-Q3522]|nr:spore coat protein GerQ [Bacillaceae bacterium Marseille-Q3522]